MPNDDNYDGPDRRAHDSTARKMAAQAQRDIAATDKLASVMAERLDGHIRECAEGNRKTEVALTTMRRMLWSIMILLLGALAATVLESLDKVPL